MNKIEFLDSSLGEILVDLPQAWEIFERYQLPFGESSLLCLRDACEAFGVDERRLLEELGACHPRPQKVDWFEVDSLTRIYRFIINRFHIPQARLVERISEQFDLVAASCKGSAHKSLRLMTAEFRQLGSELVEHMQYEERNYFPLLARADVFAESAPHAANIRVGELAEPLMDLEQVPQTAILGLETLSESLDKLAEQRAEILDLPYLACLLRGFLFDVRQHSNFESFVLLPATIRMEEKLDLTSHGLA